MRAAIYARYSAGPNQTEISIEGQEKVCRAYIKGKKYRLTEVYTDAHISGKTDRRPGFQKMITDARLGKFDVLVVYTTDRFSRGRYDIAYYKKILHDAGVRFESATEQIPSGAEGILMEALLEGISAYYSSELARKVKRGMTTRAEKADAVGGPTPFGYAVKDRKYIIKEDEAEAVRHIFGMILAGHTVSDCARYLNGAGFRTKRGKPFSPSGTKRILTNRKYTGLYRYDETEIEGGMPLIVEKDVFVMVNETLRSKSRPHAPKGDLPLSGKLICGRCGSFMTGTSGTSKTGKVHYYYKCRKCGRKNVPAKEFEKLLAGELREVLTSPQELDFIAGKVFAYQKENAPQRDAEALEANLKAVRRKKDNLIDQIMSYGKNRSLQEKVDELEAEEDRLLSKISEQKIFGEYPIEAIKIGITGAIGRKMSDADILRDLVHRVVLEDDRILVALAFTDGDKLKEVEFDQGIEWWSIGRAGRTFGVSGGLAVIEIKKEGPEDPTPPRRAKVYY